MVEDVGSSRKFCTVTENPSRILTLCILCWNCIRGDANVLAKLIVSYAQYISIFFGQPQEVDMTCFIFVSVDIVGIVYLRSAR